MTALIFFIFIFLPGILHGLCLFYSKNIPEFSAVSLNKNSTDS